MFLGFEYMKYRWNAKRRHGIHSPFMYELTDQCFRTPLSSTYQNRIQYLRRKLSKDSTAINITDHGAGSHVMGKRRRVKDIYRNSSSKGTFGRMLYQIMKHYDLKSALELGTSLGVGTMCMATGAPEANITTIEGCPETYQIARANFESLGLNNVHTINATFEMALPSLIEQQFDLIFIDGHHDGKALVNYIEQLFTSAHDNTFFILDDIRWSHSMKSAWDQLKADERFHVSIDLFRMGILVKRPQQEKEHFTILP